MSPCRSSGTAGFSLMPVGRRLQVRQENERFRAPNGICPYLCFILTGEKRSTLMEDEQGAKIESVISFTLRPVTGFQRQGLRLKA
jgi:hypothetical protein